MPSILKTIAATALLTLGLTACSPEVGSKAWCEDLEAKPKGDWSSNEAGSYTKHCLFQSDED
jgi:hypothetical protein